VFVLLVPGAVKFAPVEANLEAFLMEAKPMPETRFYRAKEIAKILSIGRSTFWGYVKDGKFSPGLKLSPRVTVWSQAQLDEFIESCPNNFSN
jgi:predicted DNA-binding transcriptional regulator AlpA